MLILPDQALRFENHRSRVTLEVKETSRLLLLLYEYLLYVRHFGVKDFIYYGLL